jgi:putative hydrolase of the HAD superfamily
MTRMSSQPNTFVRGVLWDADGVLQRVPDASWELAVGVVQQLPGALTGAPVTEDPIRFIANRLGVGHEIDTILSVWSAYEVVNDTLDVVSAVRAGGTPCYLATNQDMYRASFMRANPRYRANFDGAFYSCDIGTAKPAAEFFAHVAAAVGLQPAELLFIDDQYANVSGARKAGLCAQRWAHTDGVDALSNILAGHGLPQRPRDAQTSP